MDPCAPATPIIILDLIDSIIDIVPVSNIPIECSEKEFTVHILVHQSPPFFFSFS